MSGFSDNDSSGAASLGIGSKVTPELMALLAVEEIQPGSAPSYEICKTIFAYHPLGAKMAEAPIEAAQSQEREISIPAGPEDQLRNAFIGEWQSIGKIGADAIILNLMRTSRIYGIASVVAGAPDVPAEEPLPANRLHELDLYFNVLDPLNTAGSLTLNQDPNSPGFQKPQVVSAAGQPYHSSRTLTMLNEQPLYIEWTSSAFGFVGRSVYQRALFPLKSYVQTMITDDKIAEKAGLLVMKMQSPGAMVDQQTRGWFGMKRNTLKGAKTGNVISIGLDESIESIDLKNLRDAAEFARNNILKNIATAAKMPAVLINQETLAEGFGEGSEDAKMIAAYIDRVRIDMQPAYRYFDDIVMRRAWGPEFYKTIQAQFPEYRDIPYDTAFYEWKNSFKAVWPNLLVEPDSEKVKVDDTILKSAIAAFEVLVPVLDPENKAIAAMWLAAVINERKQMFSSPLDLDKEALESYVPPTPPQLPEEHRPIPESAET